MVGHPRHGRSFGTRVRRWWDNGGYILGMCSDLLFVASHSDSNFFSSHFERLKVWYYLSSLSIQTRVFGETLQITLMSTRYIF